MHEWDLRMLDLRQTLPNLKNLLLMLSSPDAPAPGPVTGPGWASGAASRASSRRPSSLYPQSRSASLVWSPHPASRSASIASLVWTPLDEKVARLSLTDGEKGREGRDGRDCTEGGRDRVDAIRTDSLAGASVESVMSSASARDLSVSPASPGEKRDDLTGQVLRDPEPEYDDRIEEDEGSDGTAEAEPESGEGAHEPSEHDDDASSDRTQV